MRSEYGRGTKAVLVSVLLAVNQFLLVGAANAACCKCTAPDSTDVICMTVTSGLCSTLGSASTNESIKSLTCGADPIDDAQCKLIAQGGICGSQSDPVTYKPKPAKESVKATPPKLNVPIPGVEFTDNITLQNGKLNLPYLAQYIAGVYRYLISISLIAAALMIIYGGFLYIAGSTTSKITKGKDYIKDACIGLILLFGAITVLATINPSTSTLSSIDVQYIEPQEYREGVESLNIDYKSLATGGWSAVSKPPEPGAPPAPPSPEPSGGALPQISTEPPPSGPGSLKLPPLPNSQGWIRDENCSFEMNQAGVPSALSIYKCAFEVVAKEVGVSPCYFVASMHNETETLLGDTIGHDENPNYKKSFTRPTGQFICEEKEPMSQADARAMYKKDFQTSCKAEVKTTEEYFPERIKFLNSGQSYRSIQSKGGFTFQKLSENPDLKELRQNDDKIDLSRDDLGLDSRFSHGFGLMMLTAIPYGCPIDKSKRHQLQPYYSIKSAGLWFSCVLDGLKAKDYQKYFGTIANVYLRWGGCYGPGGRPAPCVDFAKDLVKPPVLGKYTKWAYGCFQNNENPYPMINTDHLSICRGDLPIDRASCQQYLEENAQFYKDAGIVVSKKLCTRECDNKSWPVVCDPKQKGKVWPCPLIINPNRKR